MKNRLLKTFLTAFIAVGAFATVSSVKENNEDKIVFETTDDTGRGAVRVGEKRVTIGDATVTAVSETRAQYGLDEEGNYRIRFVTALTGDVSSLSYTLSVDGVEYNTYEVTTVYESVLSGEDTLYYDGTNFVTEKPATNNYYFACGSIEVGPNYYATEFTAQLTLTKSDTGTVESTAKTTTVNELVNYQYAEHCIADFESNNQIAGFTTTSWRSTLALSSEQAIGNKSLKYLHYNTYSWFGILGTGLGVDSLENYESLKFKLYISDPTETNVYDETSTYFNFSLYYGTLGTDSSSVAGSTVTVHSANEWVDVTLPLKDLNQYNLSDGKFWVRTYKKVDGKDIVTQGHNIYLYIDDVYAYAPKKYNVGEEIVNLPYYTSSNTGTFKMTYTSEDGWTSAGAYARYGIAYGTAKDNYTMFSSKDYTAADTLGTLKSNTEFGLSKYYGAYFPKYTTAAEEKFLYIIIEANELCLGKFVPEETTGGWAALRVEITKYNSAEGKWETISTGSGSALDTLKAAMSCEYQTLEAGDKLVMSLVNTATDQWRYWRPAGVAIATAVEA